MLRSRSSCVSLGAHAAAKWGKRLAVILRPDDREEWLTTSNIEAAHAMLKLHPADEMEAEAVLMRNDARGMEND